MENYSKYTDEQLVEEYKNIVRRCEQRESLLSGAGGFAKEEIKREIDVIRQKKSKILTEISKRDIVHMIDI